MNGVYLRAMEPDEYAGVLLGFLREHGIEGEEGRVRMAAPLVQEKIATLGEFPSFAGFFFEPVAPDPARLEGTDEPRRCIDCARRDRTLDGGRHRDDAARPLRAARRQAPTGAPADSDCDHRVDGLSGLFESIELLGRDETLERLQAAVAVTG